MNKTTLTVEERLEALEKENAGLKQALFQKSTSTKKDDCWSQNIIDSLPNPLFIKNDKHQFTSVNKAFEKLLKQKKEELIGKSDYDYFAKEQADIFWKVDAEVLANGTTNWNEEDLTVDGVKHKLLTSKTRISDGKSNQFLLGVITDITANENQQALLLKKNSEIEAQKTQVQTLLKEVHHRVKNNMQIISSLLNMQMQQFDNQKVQNAFGNCKNRIRAMANVHEILYQTNNFADINFETYFESLINNLRDSYKLGDEVEFETDVISLYLDIEKAIPLGLILNEIITNAIKYGAPENQKLTISTKMKCTDTTCELEIGDDGIGMNSEVATNKKGLGRELIQLLSEQIEAECQIVKSTKGVKYRLTYSPK